MRKYQRLYCKHCELIWNQKNYSQISSCPECDQDLVLKSFNPWLKIGKGLGLIVAGVSTLKFDFPVIWIGGFLWGLFSIFEGIKNWSTIKRLDNFTDTSVDDFIDTSEEEINKNI